ncbi:MAG: hypothetical protein WCC87_01665 [Candidatus Korobacteraceae bacterium]
MSARLTLLFLCDESELDSPFISALLAAGFRLLIEHHPEDAKTVLSRMPADAIMIRHNAIQDGSLVGAELKLLAPRTPIILFLSGSQGQGLQLGIDSVCHADPQDETVARAVAVFFHHALSPHPPRSPQRTPDRNMQVPETGSKTQLTL